MENKKHEEFMARAIYLSQNSVENAGGPFGAVVVKDGAIVAEGSNAVTKDNDPTAHAEVMAIRNACKALNTFDLSGCVIYTSCEPCPMCLSAMYWARISRYYYACTKDDAKEIDFDDSFIYEEIKLDPKDRFIPRSQLLHEQALAVFKHWVTKVDKIKY